MTTHKCLKGKENYKPGHGDIPGFRNKGFTLLFDIPKTAWFDPTDTGPIGSDGKDWNKLAGMSFIHPLMPWTWIKNSNSAMIAWRPAETKGWFEVTAYTNDVRTRHVSGKPILVEGGKGGAATVTVNRRSVDYDLQGHSFTHKIKRWAIAVPVGPSFGGNKKSPLTHFVSTLFKMK